MQSKGNRKCLRAGSCFLLHQSGHLRCKTITLDLNVGPHMHALQTYIGILTKLDRTKSSLLCLYSDVYCYLIPINSTLYKVRTVLCFPESDWFKVWGFPFDLSRFICILQWCRLGLISFHSIIFHRKRKKGKRRKRRKKKKKLRDLIQIHQTKCAIKEL